DKLKKCDSIQQSTFTADGEEVFTSVFSCDSTSIFREIYKYQLKEDWFFDKQKSVLEVRILSICALQYIADKETYKDLFYVYFPACRPYFAKHEVYNSKNDSERRTFEDIFWKRQFSSTIIRETNVYDRMFHEYSKY